MISGSADRVNTDWLGGRARTERELAATVVTPDARATPRTAGLPRVLVVGPPRSGTTLISQILSRAPEILSVSEPLLAHAIMPDWKLRRFLRRLQAQIGVADLRAPYRADRAAFLDHLAEVARRSGREHLVLKETFRSGSLPAAWCSDDYVEAWHARGDPAIAVLRAPHATAASTVRFCRPVTGWRGRLLRLGWPALPHFRSPDEVAAWAAENWRRFAEWVDRAGLDWIRYEDLVAAPAETACRLCEFVGAAFHEGLLRPRGGAAGVLGIGDPAVMRGAPRAVHGAAMRRGDLLTPQQRAEVGRRCDAIARRFGYGD